MIIDTKKRVVAIHLRRFLSLIVVIAIVLAIMLIGKLPHTLLGLNKYHWAIVVGVMYVIFVVIENRIGFTYIFYYDEKDVIVLRYFSLNYFNRKKHSIEIPKKEFSSFVLKDSFFGLNKKIFLRRYYKEIEAKYAPISLSILSKVQLAQLLLSLNSYTKGGVNKKMDAK
jgi:hypothetical protein